MHTHKNTPIHAHTHTQTHTHSTERIRKKRKPLQMNRTGGITLLDFKTYHKTFIA